MAYAQRARDRFPRVIAGTTVADQDALPNQCRREHTCDAFAAELLLPHAAVLPSVAILMQAHPGGSGPSDATLDELAGLTASTYDVSLTAARMSIAECLIA
jgi:Zn-dependent peptidase ImmA (M78 family)